MNTKQINEQAINSLHTFFKNNPESMVNDVNHKLMDCNTITEIVKEEIHAKEKKIASLEVLRKNIAVEAEEALEKVLDKKPVNNKTPVKLSIEETTIKLHEETDHQIASANKLKAAKLGK